jgi:CubicO group peptidase (beta-lactamase class C family)
MSLTVVLFMLSSIPIIAADSALYNGLQPDQFMRTWLILKPIPVAATGQPDESAQRKAFAVDQLAPQVQPAAGTKVTIDRREFEWTRVDSATDIVDLKKNSSQPDYAIAYAWAEIDMPQAAKAILGVGSDDGVKVWLNGSLVHENWASRSTDPDDAVPVEFRRGKNQLLLKIQNIKGDWRFACRLMGPQTRVESLVSKSEDPGDVDLIEKLLDTGLIDVNGRNKLGYTALHMARMKGNSELAKFLATHGAAPQIDELIGEDDPGVAVLVAQHGKILFEKGYGLANLEHKTPITPQTKFRIGSITKQFTASAILRLQEQGKLSVTDKLSEYISDFPRGDEVTLVHLLTHTSGIHSYTEKPGFFDTVTKPIALAALINSFKNDPYDFDPGKKWQYDNSGYALLTYVIEKVSGQSYADYLSKTFFQPLGMNDTGVHRSDLHLTHEASGYSYVDGKFKPALNWDMSQATGAGAIYSTVEDLFKWNEAVFNGKVLSDASLKAAFTPVKTSENQTDTEAGYGFGWGVDSFRGSKEIDHSGGLQGFSSFLLRLPREEFTAVALANTLPGAPGVEPAAFAHEMAEYFIGDQLAPRPANKVDRNISSKALHAITGRYDYGGPVMRVTIEDSHAYAQLSGQPRYEIFPRSETEFFWKVVDAQVTFVKDENGTVIKAVHHQGGNTINAVRLEFPSIDTASLDAIVGKYDYGQGKAILTVSRDGDQVYAQLTGQPKFDIYPKSATEYYWKVVDAQVSFVKDETGKVIKAIHHQGGNTLDAPKIE